MIFSCKIKKELDAAEQAINYNCRQWSQKSQTETPVTSEHFQLATPNFLDLLKYKRSFPL